MDLFELIAGLWHRKWLIAGLTLTAGILAVIYLLISTPTFEAKTYLRPPLASQLVSINETGVLEIDPESAFNRVAFEARSLDVQRAVFEANQEGFLQDTPTQQLNEGALFMDAFTPKVQLDIRGNGKNDTNSDELRLTIAFQHWNPAYSARVANDLARVAEERALRSVLDELQSSLRTKIQGLEEQIVQEELVLSEGSEDKIARLQEQDELWRLQLQDKINTLKSKARQLREDRIARLEEALAIASRLGLEDPAPVSLLQRDQREPNWMATAVDRPAEEEPLFLRGTRMLEAELAVLRDRKSDEHMHPELRELEQELALLEHNREVEILQSRESYRAFAENTQELRAQIARLEGFLKQMYDQVQMMRVDQQAIPPSRPIKPRKTLVVAVALMLGAVLGLVLALILNAVDTRRQEQGSTDNSQ
nr:Wzz/FepE/Etk N-terminal domain-containing protein [Kineobactrum salinum]